MSTRLLEHNADSGITEWFHYDPATGDFAIETVQDMTAIMEHNKARLYNTEKSTRYGDGMEEVARLSMVTIMELAKQQIVTPAMRILDPKKFRAWLNDPANLGHRVRYGRV